MEWSRNKRILVISLVFLGILTIVAGISIFSAGGDEDHVTPTEPGPNVTNGSLTGQNVVVSPTDFAIAVNGRGVITQQLPDGELTTMEPPEGIDGFQDIAVDSKYSYLFFALSISSQRFCSYLLSSESTLTLVNCVVSEIPVTSFSGIAAHSGNLVISGGTGGLSVFTYDTTDGTINNVPYIEGQRLDVIGLLDVQMLGSNVIAFSAEFKGSPRYGVAVSQIVGGGGNVEILREFRVDGAGTFNAIAPANFDMVNAIVTRKHSGKQVMYTANKIMTVVDPTERVGSVRVIQGPAGFEATTVAVNVDGTRVIFGGLFEGGSVFLEYDATDKQLNSMELLRTQKVQGRITSIGAGTNFIVVSSNVQVLTFFPLFSKI